MENSLLNNKAKLFIVFNSKIKSGKLTKFFTGCYAYHMGFVVPESNKIYDMNLLFRSIPFANKYKEDEMIILDLPDKIEVTEQDLLDEVLDGVNALCKNSMLSNLYGFLDYLMYGFRWFYHLFGKNTHNFNGVICSEKVRDILVKKGWKDPFKEVPSPCDFVKYFQLEE